MKQYYIQERIGRAKYVLNFHDGISKRKDGSDFWGIAIYSNKKELQAAIKILKFEGYTER